MITLDHIINQYLVMSGENDQRKYARCLAILIYGLKQLNLDTNMGFVKTVQLSVEPNETVQLPDDYVDYIKIGIVNCQGNLISLGLNSKMAPARELVCMKESKKVIEDVVEEVPLTWNQITEQFEDIDENWEDYNPTQEITTSVVKEVDVLNVDYEKRNDCCFNDSLAGTFFPTYYANTHHDNGYFIGAYFGLGGGQNRYGYYKVFQEKGYIALQNYKGASIWLEYIANISAPNGEYQVHPYFEDALTCYLQWKIRDFNDYVPANEKERLKQNYALAKQKALMRKNAFSITELVAAYNEGIMLGPKM